MARVGHAPAPEALPAQPGEEGKQVRPGKEVLAVLRQHLLAGAVRAGPERAGELRTFEVPAAAVHGPPDVDDVGVVRVVAVALEVDDGGGHAGSFLTDQL